MLISCNHDYTSLLDSPRVKHIFSFSSDEHFFFVWKIVELNLASTTDELELLISSTLSSDVTLFEKISPSSYRLRLPSMRKEAAEVQSDSEDSGSVEDDAKDSDAYSSSDDNVCDSVLDLVNPNKLVQRNIRKMKNKVLALCTEIDESHPGEAWLLGLMEGEYSHLSISEKLSSLVALVDLLNSGSSIRKEVITYNVLF